MAEPLDYETPQPRQRPRTRFWPPGYKPIEMVFLMFVFLAGAFADDYMAALGWPGWLRVVGTMVVLYVGFWLSGRWHRGDRLM